MLLTCVFAGLNSDPILQNGGITGVADSIFVSIFLSRITNQAAVVAIIRDAVAVSIAVTFFFPLVGAITGVPKAIHIAVFLIRIIGQGTIVVIGFDTVAVRIRSTE